MTAAKRILVTGGAGFLGSHLCDALAARGDTVRVLDDLSTVAPLFAVRGNIDVRAPDIFQGALTPTNSPA